MSNQAGKGDSPRNLSAKFRANYDEIDWHRPVKSGWLKRSFEIAKDIHKAHDEYSRILSNQK